MPVLEDVAAFRLDYLDDVHLTRDMTIEKTKIATMTPAATANPTLN